MVGLLAHRCAAVAYYYGVVAKVAGLPGGALDHEIGGNAGQYQRADSLGSEYLV